MRSLRARLLFGLFAILGATGLAVGTAAFFIDRGVIDGALDDELREIAQNVDPIEAARAESGRVVAEDIFVAAVWTATEHQGEADFVRPAVTGFDTVMAGGEEWRIYAEVRPERTVIGAQRMEVRRELVAVRAFEAVLPILAAVPIALLVVGWIVSRAMRPLDRLAAELPALGDRSAAIPTAGVPSEVLPLVVAMNDLLGRLKRQLEFRTRFVSDAAHELRTPLAALQLQLDAASAGGRDAVPADARASVARMSALVAQMLDLARAEAPGETRLAPLSLDEAVRSVVGELLPIAEAKGIDLGGDEAPAETFVLAEPADLHLLLRNLIDNAVRYTPPGGRVDLVAAADSGAVAFEVRDTGPGIPAAMLERVFDRFVRLDPDTAGTGLGLAIARAAAERMGATLAIRNREDGPGLVVRVRFAAAVRT
ncbi:MAG: hypothetical protein IT534_04765 [Bauldia sp.]|nr:hypothetical protein [Bauldia sp.]